MSCHQWIEGIIDVCISSIVQKVMIVQPLIGNATQLPRKRDFLHRNGAFVAAHGNVGGDNLNARALHGNPLLVSRASPSYVKNRERVWSMNLLPLVPKSDIGTTNESSEPCHVTC